MNKKSLQHIMNEMASQINKSENHGFEFIQSRQDNSTYLSQLIDHDALYADLHRGYAQASALFKKLEDQLGGEDPMVEIARDQMESAKSALQTRRIECESDPHIMQKILASIEIDNEDKRILQSCKDAALYKQKQDALSEEQKQQAIKNGKDGFFWTMIILMLLQDTIEATVQNFNLVKSFSHAAHIASVKHTDGIRAV